MRTRNIIQNEDGTYNIVWFGSAGLNSGNKIPANNYVINDNEMVAKSLIQRLSIIKGELCYDLNYGLPLADKIRDKAIFDIKIMEIINNHPYVSSIKSFNSFIKDQTYNFSADIITVYNNSITISSDYSI